MSETNQDIAREILEGIKAFGSHSQASTVCSRTSLRTESLLSVTWRFELLAQQGFIAIIAKNIGGDFMVRLTPKGEERLSLPEGEYRKSLQSNPAIRNTVTFHRKVQNVVQSLGANSSATQHNETNAALDKLFERLFSEIADNSNLTSTEKINAEIEAQQLQLEMKKPTPNTDKIKTAVSFLVAYAPLVIELMKPYLPT